MIARAWRAIFPRIEIADEGPVLPSAAAWNLAIALPVSLVLGKLTGAL
jgi:hypothetical protein